MVRLHASVLILVDCSLILGGLLVCSPAGTKEHGPVACENCTIGSYSLTSASSKCDACPIGKVAERAGLSACSDCQPGELRSSPSSFPCSLLHSVRLAMQAKRPIRS